MVAAACGRDLYFWDVSSEDDTKQPHKVLETTIGFLCLYFHPNGKWLITCEGLRPLPSPPFSLAPAPPPAPRPTPPTRPLVNPASET